MSTIIFGTPPADVPGSLPTTFIPDGADLQSAASFLKTTLESPTAAAFTDDALWRDWLVFHDRVRTRNASNTIADKWTSLNSTVCPADLQILPGARVVPSLSGSWVDVSFTFKAQKAGLPVNCSGSAGVAFVDGAWKIFSLMTMLENVVGHGNCDDPSPNLAIQSHDPHVSESGALQYDVVIIGAGQNGLSAAGRLGALGIRYLVIEKDDEIGSCWSKRYESVRLHTGRETNNLPFGRTWSADDDYWLTGKTVGEGFKRYVQQYNINVWLKSTITHADKDERANKWNIQATKDGKAVNIESRHLIFATGSVLSHPRRPKIAGESDYKGTLLHAIDFKNANAWKGKKAVVIGSATQAHDVAKDMVDSGLKEVHMIQRTETPVYAMQTWSQVEQAIFNREIPTEVSDRGLARPTKHAVEMMDKMMLAAAKAPPVSTLHEGLEKAGFRVKQGSGMMETLLTKAGTQYLDVGASQYIIDGRIKVKSGVPISHFTADGLAFADGSEMKADVIMYCTGYAINYHEHIGAIVGMDKVKDLGPAWGLDADGEVHGHMIDKYPGLWVMGGSAANARLYSRFVALQIQFDLMKAKEANPKMTE